MFLLALLVLFDFHRSFRSVYIVTLLFINPFSSLFPSVHFISSSLCVFFSGFFYILSLNFSPCLSPSSPVFTPFFVLVSLHSFSFIYFVIIFKPSLIFFYHPSSGFTICGFATLNLVCSCPLNIV